MNATGKPDAFKLMDENTEAKTFVMLPEKVVKDGIEAINARFDSLESLLSGKTEEIMTSTAARNMVGVSAGTWKTYRDRKLLPFIYIGRRIFVRRSDVEAFLQEHTIK